MSDYTSIAPPQSNINQSQAFAAALQRAKQIAAKIQPGTTQQQQPSPVTQLTNSQSGVYKRPLNDEDSGPDAKKFSSPDSYNSSSQGGNMSQAVAQAAAVAARIAATAGTTCEEQIRIPDCIVSLIFGRGSNDTLSHIQAESCCKVHLAQDGEHVITLRGSRETVTKGRDMIQQMAIQNGGGTVDVIVSITMPPPGPNGYPPYQEIMVAGSKVGLVIGKGGETIKMLQQKTGAKMVIIQDGPNQEVIKPLRISGDPQKIDHAKQLVLELIADKDGQRTGGISSNGSNYNNVTGGEQAEVFVPKTAVGVVIGKGGDMIRKIQGETGCKLQFIQGKNDEPGDRRCIIQGTQQQVEDAQRMIEGLIESVMQRINSQTNRMNANPGQNDNANSNYGYGYGVNHTQQPAREEVTFSVPASKCGIVIGRGGETIKLINQQTGAYCEMDRSAVNPPSEKLFKAKGTPEQIEHARQMISEKINMDLVVTSRKPIGNLPNNHQQNSYNNNMQTDPNVAAAAYQQQWGYAQQGSWGDQQQQQQQMSQPLSQTAVATGGVQADYSTQWIEYYKSMGMHREAEMIEQQLKVKQQTSAAASSPAMAGSQQVPGITQQVQVQANTTTQAQTQDFSAQWAEYYRSIGKIEEADAIEKQIKAANGQTNVAISGTTVSSGNIAAAAPSQGYPQGMTPSQYAQYSQYYAAAAAAGQAASGYPPQAYPGYGNNYTGTQPGMQSQGSQPNLQKPAKTDKK